MALVSSELPSAYPGYQWPHAGAVVEMPDEEAAALIELAGPDGGYAIVAPPQKRQRGKAVAEPAKPGGLSEVVPEGGITEDGAGKAAPKA
jgi:hypothetical protein